MFQECKICGKGFKVPSYTLKIGKGKTCSRECFYKRQKEIVRTGKKSPNWKDDVKVYRYAKVDGKRVLRHRLAMEQHIGRALRKEEVVHHIDGNIGNNDINNLILFPSASAHSSYHALRGDVGVLRGKNV